MSEFIGVIGLRGIRYPHLLAERLAQSLDGVGVDRPRIWQNGPAVIVHRQSHYLTGKFERQPIQIAPGQVLVGEARLDEGVELAQQLRHEHRPHTDDMTLLAAACRRWGESTPDRLYGDFAFALWDAHEEKLTLARDALGTRSLYYAHTAELIVFATQIRALLSIAEIPRELDDLALADFITLAPTDNDRTIYRHIHRVPAGGTVTFHGLTRSVGRYWTAERITSARFARDNEYVDAARELLDRAVARRLRCVGPIASMLSGGFDSAGVTATAATLLGTKPLIAYTRAPGGPHPYDILDEQALAAKVVSRYQNIEWIVVDEVAAAPRDSEPESEAPLMGVPRRNAFNPTWFEAIYQRAVKSGVRVLLAGSMGNAVLSWGGHALFGELLRSGRFLGALGEIGHAAKRNNYSFVHALRRYAAPVLEPRTIRRWRHGRRFDGFPWLRYCLISPSFFAEIDYAHHANQTGHDLPFHIKPDGKSVRASMLMSEHPLDVGTISRLRYGVETRDPYRDRRFVEFMLAVPESQFFRHGQSRWLGRRVLADRLPAELLSQTRKGSQCPEWHHLASRRVDKMAEAVARIERSPLASRVLDIKRMKALLDSWPESAEAAKGQESLYQHALHRGIIIGSFLRWFEGGNA